MSYQITKPGKGRRSFAILEKVVKPGGVAGYRTVELEELGGINRDFQAGILAAVEALRLVKQLKDNLYKKRDREKPLELFTNDNRKLLDEF
jgi:hypothetical protein